MFGHPAHIFFKRCIALPATKEIASLCAEPSGRRKLDALTAPAGRVSAWRVCAGTYAARGGGLIHSLIPAVRPSRDVLAVCVPAQMRPSCARACTSRARGVRARAPRCAYTRRAHGRALPSRVCKAKILQEFGR